MLQPPPPPSCVQFAPPIVQLLLLAAEYTLMLILLLAVFMCSLWFLVHREFPYCHHPTTLSIRAPPSSSTQPPSHPPPCAPTPTLCPAPHFGWPGCCSEGSSHPRSCQRPPSFPWAEHTIEKGLRLRGSVAINPYQLFLPRVFCATIRAPEGALTSTNLAIVGEECWQKKRNFSCVHASVCIHVWEPRNVGLISIVAREEGRPWRIPPFSCLTKFFGLKMEKTMAIVFKWTPSHCFWINKNKYLILKWKS